jgi:hypothetical protein
MAATRAERQAAANRLAQQERALISLHLEATAPPQRPEAPAPKPVDQRALRTKHTTAALAGIAKPRRWQQRVVAELAAETAANQARQIAAERARAQAAEQARLNEEWARFDNGDPLMVGQAVTEAFRGQRPRVEVVDTDGRDLTLVIEAPTLNAIPDKMPAVTPTGQGTVKARPKGERNELYAAHLASIVLGAVRRVVWSAPSIATVEVLMVGRDRSALVPLFHGDFERARLRNDWSSIDPYDIEELTGYGTTGFERSGRNGDVVELPSTDELAELLQHAAQALDLTTGRPSTLDPPSAAQTRIGGSHE